MDLNYPPRPIQPCPLPQQPDLAMQRCCYRSTRLGNRLSASPGPVLYTTEQGETNRSSGSFGERRASSRGGGSTGGTTVGKASRQLPRPQLITSAQHRSPADTWQQSEEAQQILGDEERKGKSCSKTRGAGKRHCFGCCLCRCLQRSQL